ncbi:hypothetical protein SMICM304S_01969 [Streptomyces microflavus]
MPETAAVSAWKWLTSPAEFLSSYLPRTTSRASRNLRTWTKPNQPVKTRPATASQVTMSGTSAPPILTE